MSALVDFYSGAGKDHAGRKIDEIWAWSDENLEGVHDYIQWLFPNRASSAFNPNAPILTDEDALLLRERPFLQARVLRSFQRMCTFYHIDPYANIFGIKAGPPYWWDDLRFSHNWLRMTRILLCLNECGLESNAIMFQQAISRASLPDSRTRGFWLNAMKKS